MNKVSGKMTTEVIHEDKDENIDNADEVEVLKKQISPIMSERQNSPSKKKRIRTGKQQQRLKSLGSEHARSYKSSSKQRKLKVKIKEEIKEEN